jgi:hypothetical protein
MSRIILPAAMACTGLGIVLAAASAAERGATLADRVLLMASAGLIALAAHLLPALARHRTGQVGAPAWALWGLCILATLYGHAAYLASAADRAGQARAEQVQPSQAATAIERQAASAQARPLAIVASDVATASTAATRAELALRRCDIATSPDRCAARQVAHTQAAGRLTALQTEQAEAQRAKDLQAQITAAATATD